MKGRFTDLLKYHLFDSTAISTEANPIFSAMETFVAGMTDEVSINARLIGTGQTYLGIGFVYGKGRDLWRKYFGITDLTSEKVQNLHDMAYSAAVNIMISPIMYYISGSRDFKEIATGALGAAGIGLLNGGTLGYAIDVFRDLTGVEQCNRRSYPDFIKKRSTRAKKMIATGLAAASIGASGLVYSLTP